VREKSGIDGTSEKDEQNVLVLGNCVSCPSVLGLTIGFNVL